MVINMIKSKALAMDENAQQLYADKKMFELVERAVALGVGIDRKGVYSTAYLKTILKRIVTKVRTIMQAGVRLGGLRPDMGLHLYASLAQSIVKYALPLTAASSMQVQKLDEQQARFARDYLSLPPTTPPHAAKAELGLLDYDLASTISKMLLHHRINSSPDTFTRGLVKWDIGGHTTRSKCETELRTLMPHITWGNFANMPYRVAKADLKEAAEAMQVRRWNDLEHTLGHETAYASRSKPRWGIERSLHLIAPTDVVAYIQVRNGAGIGEHLEHGGMCALCAQHVQSEAHILWACMGTRGARNKFQAEATQVAPEAMRRLNELQPRQAFHFLMGAGARDVSEVEWAKFQPVAVKFVVEAFGGCRET